MTVGGMPLIELVARRASRTGHEVIVATSVEPYDDRIATHLQRVGVPVVRGSLDDVLGRFVQATEDMEPTDRVVRLTGDNPIADGSLVDELIVAMEASGHAYARVDIDQVPEGLGAEVFSVEDLRAANQQATAAYDREHVTPWLRRELGELLFAPKKNPGDPIAYRCTTDCLNDYDRISRLFDDEADPVAVPWDRLVEKLKVSVDAQGPMAPVASRKGPRLTRITLGTARIGRTSTDETRDGATVRDVFATAVNRGISHVLAEPGLTGVVRQGTIPALQQRLGTLVKLPSLTRRESSAGLICQVRASAERAFADLGNRRVAGLLLGSVEDALAGESAAWRRLGEYRAEGVASEIGVCLTETAEAASLAQLPGLDLVVVPVTDTDRRFLAQGIADVLSDLAASGVTVLADVEASSPETVREVLDVPWVASVVVDPARTADLAEALAVAR